MLSRKDLQIGATLAAFSFTAYSSESQAAGISKEHFPQCNAPGIERRVPHQKEAAADSPQNSQFESNLAKLTMTGLLPSLAMIGLMGAGMATNHALRKTGIIEEKGA